MGAKMENNLRLAHMHACIRGKYQNWNVVGVLPLQEGIDWTGSPTQKCWREEEAEDGKMINYVYTNFFFSGHDQSLFHLHPAGSQKDRRP